MLIFPAIDLKDGRCVRLSQGNFEAETRYGDPVDQAKAFAGAGAQWIHVVDLDGAQAGSTQQSALIGAIAKTAGVNIQCGGGVRSGADVAALLDAGVLRVVVGSIAVKHPEEFSAWLQEFGAERLCAAFDARPECGDFMVATHGWTERSGVSLTAAIGRFSTGLLRHALVTDVSRDGMLGGPNIDLYAELVSRFPAVALQASGGVADLEDLSALKTTGVSGVIVGRALYEKKFSLEAALAC